MFVELGSTPDPTGLHGILIRTLITFSLCSLFFVLSSRRLIILHTERGFDRSYCCCSLLQTPATSTSIPSNFSDISSRLSVLSLILIQNVSPNPNGAIESQDICG